MDPKTLKFMKNHQWCHVEGDVVTVGITDYAAKRLKDVIFIEMPDPGDDVLTDEPMAEIESADAATLIFSPADGVAEQVNSRLTDDPDLMVSDPYGQGWLVRVKASAPAPLDDLLTYEQYRAVAKGAGASRLGR